jgi:DNA polymerase III subunit alpha, Gram-positive type
MFANFLSEIGVKSELELKGIEVSALTPLGLQIITPQLLPAQTVGRLLYALFNKLCYLFDYLDYQIKVQEKTSTIGKEILQEYLILIFSTPFLWKDKNDLVFFWKDENVMKDFDYQNNTIYLLFADREKLTVWSSHFLALKEILKKLGWADIRFTIQQKKNGNSLSPITVKSKNLSPLAPKPNNNRYIFSLPEEWKKRKLFELGVHTKFSTLDGVSSPADYVKNAKEKNYAALAITDHYNVQSFPEFSQNQTSELQIIYGCELEMLENDLPPYLFNHNSKLNRELCLKKITDLTYCVFDLETTGFFSEYNEIIELGYVIWKNGEIQQGKEYLIRPEREIAPEVLANWYTDIDPQELKKSPKIGEILPHLEKDWENCILVAHNARKFDYGFLNKAWKRYFGKDLPYPVIDTLPLSWILLPERKSYSLERLSRLSTKDKIKQSHRALDDSKLLVELLGKLIDSLQEKKIEQWGEIKKLINPNYFPNRGSKIKVLARNQTGLRNLYRLITLSHTKRLFRKPCVFRSDVEECREGLLVGTAGGQEGEIFWLFSSFCSFEQRKKKMRFYDYIEVNSPQTFRYLWQNGQIREEQLKNMTKQIIRLAAQLNIPFVASHNVHYCQSKEKILKEIIVANEGMGGSRHYLFNQATLEGKEDRFADLPTQHLLTVEEMLNNWTFLSDKELIEKILFQYPQQIADQIGQVIIHQPPLNYSATSNVKNEEKDLIAAYTQRANELFGSEWPDFVQERIAREWKIIHGRYVFIYWLAYKVVQKTHADGYLVGSRGSIGSSFIAYLCGITDLNPLPFYKFCYSCRYTELYQSPSRIYSCYDYRGEEKCPRCVNLLTMEGHNLPFETFFGWEGEKSPDIDLNFSGEYQKNAHNYVRQLLGEDSVYRIGTINTLSQQTAEIFWKEHLKLRSQLNPNFSEEKWNAEWANKRRIQNLQQQLIRLRQEKIQLEKSLKLN